MGKNKMKIIIAPNSFKGTMSSLIAGTILKEEIEKKTKNVEIKRFSIADGGDNTIDIFYENFNGQYIEDTFSSPDFSPQKFKYVRFNNTAVVEAGQCAGLSFTKIKNPMYTTSFGMGEQIMHAISSGVNNIIIALGGSATNDAGAGLLSALGLKFLDNNNQPFIPTGITLQNIMRIDTTELQKNIHNVHFTVISDVNNQLYGKNGAAYLYAEQKGANKKEIKFLDDGLKHFAKIVKEQFGIDISTIKGGGSAGGIGAGCFAFLRTDILSGIDVILDILNFDDELNDTDLVITGEGKFDKQSMMGKAIGGISERTSKRNIPLIIFTGINEFHNQAVLDKYKIKRIYQLSTPNQSFEDIKKNSKNNLRKSARIFIKEFQLDEL